MASYMKLKINPPKESKKNASEKQTHANQKDASTTGPKSVRGKRTVRVMLRSMGCWSRIWSSLPVAWKIKENLTSSWLHSEIITPDDFAEDLIVQEIAASYWKTRRGYRCERGDVTCYSAQPGDPAQGFPPLTCQKL